MADIREIKKLREATGAGIGACQEALDKHKGDQEKAKKYLKEKGVDKAAKRADRETSEGVVAVYLHPNSTKLAALLEMQSETDFVARNEQFQEFANDAAMQVAGMSPQFISRDDVTKKDVDTWKEEIKEGRKEKVSEQEMKGRIASKYKELCLLEQPSIKDSEKTIGELLTDLIAVIGENMKIARFVRFEMGKPVVVAEAK